MRHRQIKEVMTADVAFVSGQTDFKDIVRVLAERGVSALPVVDDQRRVIGVVSGADLLAKQSQFEEPRLLRALRSHRKASGTVAGDLMTTPAITIDGESTVVHGARLLAKHNIKRLPVIDADGRLIGIVGRRNLLSVFLRKDNDIRHEIVHDVFEHGLGVTVNPTTVDVMVHDGMVTLLGELETKSQVAVADAMTRRVDGVVDVNNQLAFMRDDTHVSPPEVPVLGAIRVPRDYP